MAGTDRRQAQGRRQAKTEAADFAAPGGPAIILVRPQLGENIGTAARAMLNCGLMDLRLVAPRDGWPNVKALNAASGADAVIGGARIFDTVAEAVAELDMVYATTARGREMVKPVLSPRQAAENLRRAPAASAGILFGPERSGLDNDDVVLADAIIEVALNPAFASLNLAQAVLIISYEWCAAAGEAAPERLPASPAPAASKKEILNFFDMLEGELDARSFYPTAAMRPKMTRNMRNLFQRIQLSHQDVQSLFGIVKSLTRPPPGEGGKD
ncbi:MAG: RNA methyltransferase [Alphaproteobacteria bacterium]|jgi:tRNA/rRNA methyltransferase|nr:RNA methyltransferase [Alphaproteobacteria bacterium]MDP6589649.1 RNA methyltransferase [Alphaproteobacteria bacterium]